jgi:UDP-sugar transporter A1/2/3
MAYQNLSPVTFNVLNQTKTLSAAQCCFIVMGRMQSKLQIVSLFILLLSALVIEKVVPLPSFLKRKKIEDTEIVGSTQENADAATTTEAHQEDSRRSHLLSGVLPVLMASFLSGLAGALSQRSLMDHGRNSYLFTMELSSASSILLILSLLLNSPDGKKIRTEGFFSGWTLKTTLPVVTNALGGILVGLVTKYAGSVRKGFALIFGLLLSGIWQTKYMAKSDEDSRLTPEQVLGGVLAALSLWMHARFPHVATNT